MHYSQGRDRWFGRIQSAPTGYVNEMCRKSSLKGGDLRVKALMGDYGTGFSPDA
ncbi:MAG: hypothetical protein LUI85_04340 [Bacteroides sp.]|nr:hypothetical protein [Bacteroides sp.]